MPLTYQGDVASFVDVVGVEEAEGLLQWLQEHPEGTADLSACTHLHAALLQILMAGAVAVSSWPRDLPFENWLTAALANR